MRDEVDDLIQAWHRERPDLDLRPMAILSRVSRLSKHLDQMRKTAFSAHNLESWEFDVLAALRRSGEPYQLAAGELTRQTMVTSGTMTNRIDRLEARTLVRRAPDPHDRRGVLVLLTEAGRATVDGALVTLLASEGELVNSLPQTDQDLLTTLLRPLTASFEQEGD